MMNGGDRRIQHHTDVCALIEFGATILNLAVT